MALFVSNATVTQIGSIDGNFTYVFGINNFGDIVGEGKNDDGGLNGISWIGGTFTDLAPFGILLARSIDDSQTLVGTSGYTWNYGGYVFESAHACMLDVAGNFTDLGNLTGDPKTDAEAFAINDAGQAVGNSMGSDGLKHAFR